MRNYGHKFASGSIFFFYLAIVFILRNIFDFDFFNFCEQFELFKKHEIMLPLFIACFIFPQAAFLDNLVEKYEFTEEQRDKMYFSIMGGSILITVLSFVI